MAPSFFIEGKKVDAPSVLMEREKVHEHDEMQPVVLMEGQRQGQDQEQEHR